jgi:arabinofuranan 3-O-arabinosyltransferase
VTASASDLYAGKSLPARVCPVVGAEAAGSAPASVPGGAAASFVSLAQGANDVTVRHSAAFELESLVLRAEDAGTIASSAVDTPLERIGPVRLVAQPAQGPGLLSVPQNYSKGWHASQGSSALQPLVVDGWQQGWVLSGGRAEVSASFGPDSTYRAGLLVGLVGLLGLFLGVLVRRRRRADPSLRPLEPARGSRALVAAVTLTGGGLVAGWAGIVLALVLLAVVPGAMRSWPDVTPWVLALPAAVASVAYVLQPWGTSSGWAGGHQWPHYLALVPLLAVLAAAVPGSATPRNRIAGSSIKR